MPAGALCSATYQPEKVRPENAFNHSWDGFLPVQCSRQEYLGISGNAFSVCHPTIKNVFCISVDKMVAVGLLRRSVIPHVNLVPFREGVR